jgi:hypothetical protein
MRGGGTNGFDDAPKPLTTSTSRPTTTTSTTTKTTMERREEAWRHDEQRRQRVETANYFDVETKDGTAGRGAAAGEGAARDKRQRRRCVDTTDDDNDNDDNVVPISALSYWLFIPCQGGGHSDDGSSGDSSFGGSCGG